jgi:hypothetical protein
LLQRKKSKGPFNRTTKQFSIKQAPIPKRKNLTATLKALEDNSEKLDALKEKNEYFGFSFFGNHSYQVFDSVEQLVQKLGQYKVIQESHGAKGKRYEEIVKNVKIIKWRGTPNQWAKDKEKEFKKNQKAKLAEAREKLGLKREVRKLKKQVKQLRTQKRKARKR